MGPWVLGWTDSSELMPGSSLLWRLYTFLVCFYIQTYPSDSICRLGLVHPFAGTRRNDEIAKDCLLTLVKSRLALGSPGCLFGRSFVTMLKMAEYTEK